MKDKELNLMKTLKYLLPLLLILLLAAFPAMAEEAEDLTAHCTVKAVKTNNVVHITDGKYTTFWESGKTKKPWVTISSDKPIYGLYLCFQKLPDTYAVQKVSGDDWVTVAEGGEPRYHHAFFELDGVKKVRIISTMEKANSMGFNEIYAFGQGEVPDWVQRWEEPVEKADLLFMIAHPDDELLFTGGAIPVYGAEKGYQVQVAYFTSSNTTRRSEALNGLWAMGVRNYPVFGAFADRYSNGKSVAAKANAAYKTAGGKQKVLDWVNELFRRFRPEVVVTHGTRGEYGHAQHILMADACDKCFTLAAEEGESPESARKYGTWQVKKLYLHQLGENGEETVLDWNEPLQAFGGKTGAEMAAEAFALHVSQKGMGAGTGKNFKVFTVETTGAVDYPYDHFVLQETTVGPDEAKDDFLEHIDTGDRDTKKASGEEAAAPAEKETEEDGQEPEIPEDETEAVDSEPEAGDNEPETADDDTEVTEEETTAENEPEEPADGGEKPEEEKLTVREGSGRFKDVTPPAWADVKLNANGFLDEGEYVFADDEEGHYMFANPTLRVVIERTIEQPDAKHPFYCFTAHIWCDTDAGELPVTVYNDPEKPKSGKEFMRNIAMNNKVVFATTTDYYIYRIKQKYPTGIEVRNGEVIFDDPHKLEYGWGAMPTYETLALYRDGHADSLPNPEKSAGQYVEEGAVQVYSFGPCLVKNGELTEYAKSLCNKAYNPRLAIGVVENGHYVVMMCEGRIKRSKGVKMDYLAELMLKQGCSIAVNMDGGQSAVVAFMGHQLNEVWSKEPNGRSQADILAFGFSDQVGSFEMADKFKTKKK